MASSGPPEVRMKTRSNIPMSASTRISTQVPIALRSSGNVISKLLLYFAGSVDAAAS